MYVALPCSSFRNNCCGVVSSFVKFPLRIGSDLLLVMRMPKSPSKSRLKRAYVVLHHNNHLVKLYDKWYKSVLKEKTVYVGISSGVVSNKIKIFTKLLTHSSKYI